MQKADDAARAAQENALTVRQLRQKLDATKSRAATNREKVEEYSRYRAFLANITPQASRGSASGIIYWLLKHAYQYGGCRPMVVPKGRRL